MVKGDEFEVDEWIEGWIGCLSLLRNQSHSVNRKLVGHRKALAFVFNIIRHWRRRDRVASCACVFHPVLKLDRDMTTSAQDGIISA